MILLIKTSSKFSKLNSRQAAKFKVEINIWKLFYLPIDL